MSGSRTYGDASPALEWRSGEVALVRFDDPGLRVNLLTPAVMAGLDRILGELEGRAGLRRVVFCSGKPDVFLAGVDVEELARIAVEGEGTTQARRGQKILSRLAALEPVTVAAVGGTCLGGGLELALACDLRVAADAPGISLGLPEVHLGIVPALGGTQRLSRLVGFRTAVEMVVTGRSLNARQARRHGLVDALAPPDRLEETAATLDPPARRRIDWPDRFLVMNRWLRALVARQVRSRAARHVSPELMPAPFQALDLVEASYRLTLELGLEREAEVLGECLAGETARNLISLFRARRSLRHEALHWRGAAPPPLERVAMVVAGEGEPALTGMARKVGYHVMEAEAGPLEERQTRLAGLEEMVSPEVVLATVAPPLRVRDLTAGLAHPERVVGLHDPSPRRRVPLMEVIFSEVTDPAAVATAADLARRLGQVPLVVRDRPGFLVHRILLPYLAEALRLVAEGVSFEVVDRVARRFGLSEGPIACLDRLGLDMIFRSATGLAEVLDERRSPPALLAALVEGGRRGGAPGEGCYGPDGRPSPEAVRRVPGYGRSRAAREEIRDRLVLTLVAEAVRALEEGVVEHPLEVDVGMVLGAGFPPPRGGPLRYAGHRGLKEVVRRLHALAGDHGDHLRPPRRLEQIAGAGETFYDDPPPRGEAI